MNETRRLAEFAAGCRYEDLPSSVIEAVRVYILDNLASGLVGSRTPWAEMVSELARETAPDGPCSLFQRPWTTSPSHAALVNGTMIGGFETDHAFVPGSCHPSAAVFPAALAIGERDHLDGRSFITAVAAGYELACRVGAAATRAVEDERGFHGPGTNAPFGGAAGAGRALGLDAEAMANALGIAGSHAGGLLEFTREGAMTKRLHVARGAQMGLESALLASKAFTGPSTVLEGEKGFLRVYSPSPRPELLVEDLGERYLLLEMLVKAYACHASFHPVIDGIHRLRAGGGLEAATVASVRVAGYPRMIERHDQRAPVSVLGAQYSLPFSVAVALRRDIADPLVYSEETLWDPAIRKLSASVELAVDGERFGKPGGPTAEVSLTVGDSVRTFEVSGWKGAPADPYTFDEMAEKFRRYARPCMDSETTEKVVRLVAELEDLDVADVAVLLRTDAG